MSHEALMHMARRTLAHTRAGTVPLAEGIVKVPAANYVDPDRYRAELDLIFRRLPLVAAASAELHRPRDYRSIDLAGVPVLVVRGDDGEVRAYLNMCSHRGAVVVPEGHGSARRFTCPYHAWTYDAAGCLVGVLDREEFGPLDVASHGLRALPAAERAGLVFVVPDPTSGIDIDAFLSGYDQVLDHLGLDRCWFVGQQRVAGPNWKVAYDGYLDFYHLPILHKDTFGTELSNQAIYDAWGPHQRVSSPDERLLRFDALPDHDWPLAALIAGVWTVFPQTSIAGFPVKASDGSATTLYMVSTLYPGADVASSTTQQTFLSTVEPTLALQAAIEAQMRFLLGVVRDEDYATGLRIQQALATGLRRNVLFGRNEAGGQRFHGWVDRLLAARDAGALAALFAVPEVVHQP
ncbi:MAG: aromatic ring-hydroxylating dioxygenase subunit alpha [Acidimicrobiales bacterium]